MQSGDHQKFLALLDLFPAASQFERDYIARSKVRGWATYQHLPRGTGKEKLLDVGSMKGIYAPGFIEIWNYASVDLLGDDTPPEGFIERQGANGRTHRLPTANCNIETQRWPYPDQSFDAAVCTEVLEHMMFDPVFVMNEMSRVLKPGGFCLITTPNTTSDSCLTFLVNGMQPGFLRFYATYPLRGGKRDLDTVAAMGHFHEYTRADLECLAAATGFDVELMSGISPFPPQIDSFRFRLLKMIVHALFPRSRRIREEQLLAIVRKRSYTPLDQLPQRYPEPLYREPRA